MIAIVSYEVTKTHASVSEFGFDTIAHVCSINGSEIYLDASILILSGIARAENYLCLPYNSLTLFMPSTNAGTCVIRRVTMTAYKINRRPSHAFRLLIVKKAV
jgi:hypothetical protein